jgi:FMN-dependent NADH-azoreductase
MTILLRIDASPRGGDSHSRRIGDVIERALQLNYAVHHDLAVHPVHHLDAQAIAGFFADAQAMTPELARAVAVSDQVIAEVEAADVLLITTPMFNFAVPSVLKAWIDQLVRVNRSFSYDGVAFQGLLKGKRAIVVIAYGAAGYAKGQPLHGADFARPYLDFILRFVGIEDVHFVTLDATNAGPDALAAAQADTDRQLASLFAGTAAYQHN